MTSIEILDQVKNFINYLLHEIDFRPVEYVVECSDSEGMRLWLLTIQSNMRPHGMSLSDLAEHNR